MKLKYSLGIMCTILLWTSFTSDGSASTPIPQAWPDQFRAILFMNMSDTRIKLSDLWYDWPNGRNINIFQYQLGDLLYDIEWNNGTSFYYTVGPNGTCRVEEFGVGIPRPDFLDGAVYLGTQVTDGFLCNVWQKVDFIWYYEDVLSKRPVRWDFYDGIQTHVMTFEKGVVLPESVIQAPAYCFPHESEDSSDELRSGEPSPLKRLAREISSSDKHTVRRKEQIRSD